MSTIRVTASTMGVTTPASVAAGTGWYRWRGNPAWPGGHREPETAEHPQNARAAAGRRTRLAEWERLRVEEHLTREQAATRMGIQRSTAGSYERHLKNRQRDGEAG